MYLLPPWAPESLRNKTAVVATEEPVIFGLVPVPGFYYRVKYIGIL